MRVVPRLSCPAVPKRKQVFLNLNQLPELRVVPSNRRLSQARKSSDFWAAISQGDSGQRLLLADKPITHATMDMICANADENAKTSLTDLTTDELADFLKVSARFGRFCDDPFSIRAYGLAGSVARMVFNHDPFTRDREGLQSIERFHVHLYLIPPHLRELARAGSRFLSEIECPYTRLQLCDPLSFLGPSLIEDLHEAGRVKVPTGIRWQRRDPAQVCGKGEPLGFRAEIEAGWAGLADPTIAQYVTDLHQAMIEGFSELSEAFTGRFEHHSPIGTRANLKPRREIFLSLESIEWLSEQSRSGLYQLALQLQPASERLLKVVQLTANQKHGRMAIQRLALNGLVYSMSFSTEQDVGTHTQAPGPWTSVIGAHSANVGRSTSRVPLKLNVLPRLFADEGGAGLFGLDSVSAVWLRRDDREMLSDRDLELRGKFRRGLIEEVIRTATQTAERMAPALHDVEKAEPSRG